MKFPTMFSPVQIGTVTVPNRFVVPPMGNNLANTDGTLSDRSLSYYQARAKGSFGLITIESTVVYREAKGGPRKPCLFSDDTVESFRRVADACHAELERQQHNIELIASENIVSKAVLLAAIRKMRFTGATAAVKNMNRTERLRLSEAV